MARLVRRRAVGGAPCTFSTCPSLPAATIPGPSPLPFTPPLETSGRPSPLACAQPTLVTRAWVEEELEVSREHLTPELPLHLLTPACRLYWGRGEEAPLADPWWAIYWPGGQVLARYLLDHPASVSGRRVVDLGSGGGAATLAAVSSGAAAVTANDIDPACRLALAMNAELSGTSLEAVAVEEADLLDPAAFPGQLLATTDVLLVGDMLYDEQMGDRVFALCRAFKGLRAGNEVYIGDPGRWVLEARPALAGRLACLARTELGDAARRENSGLTTATVWRML